MARTAVHHTLYRILGSNQDMEDVLQETFLEVFRSMSRYAARSSLVTWCCAIASHVALGNLRGRRRPMVELSDELPSREPDAERIALAREAARRLYGALDKIDPVHRIAFALAVVDGKSLQEVAELTDSSLSAVKTRVWRARKELDRLAGRDPVLSAYVAELADGEPAREGA
jgi:RNA polymerase sigma-70 factor (ECF subfamily)